MGEEGEKFQHEQENHVLYHMNLKHVLEDNFHRIGSEGGELLLAQVLCC